MPLQRADWLQDIEVLDLLHDQDRVSEGLLPGVPEGQLLQLVLIQVSVLMRYPELHHSLQVQWSDQHHRG